MSFRRPLGWIAIALLGAACDSPVRPTGSVTVMTPAAVVGPANGAQIAFDAQPVTLTIANAPVTGDVGYTFEVAVDAQFVSKVAIRDVDQAPTRTSVTLDPLLPREYFWRVRTSVNGTPGAFTMPMRFAIGVSGQ
jgi:hypothetical protein